MTTSSPTASAAPRPHPVSFGAGRLSPSGRSGDGLSKAQLRGVVFAIAALHVGAGWGLLQIPAVREAVADVAPIFVEYIAPPPPPPPAKPAPPPPPAPPVVRRPPPPAPLITSKPSPAPAPFVAPPPPMVIPAPTPPAAPAPEAPAAPPAPPAVAAPPGPVLVRNVEYLFQPKLEYPERSLQLGETGRVLVRVVVDVNGLPRAVTIEKSSGYARLNQAALVATKKARFKPHTINGQPVEMESLIPFEFQQEN